MRIDSKCGQFVIKWTLILWFLLSNGFSIEKAISDIDQTIRKIDWDNKIRDAKYIPNFTFSKPN